MRCELLQRWHNTQEWTSSGATALMGGAEGVVCVVVNEPIMKSAVMVRQEVRNDEQKGAG